MRPVQANTSVQSHAVVARSRAYGPMVTLVLALCAAALPVQAQIEFRAAGPQSSGTGASITAAIPAGVQSGDLAVLIIAGRPTNATQPSAPTGWTLRSSSLREVGANDLKIMTFYRVLGASNPNPVVSLPSAWQGNQAGMSAQIAVWSGVNTTTPFDVPDVTSNAVAVIEFGPTAIGTATNGARVVSAVATSDDNQLSLATGTGFTARMSGANYDTTTGGDHSVGLADKAQAVAGPLGAAWRQEAQASDQWAAITFALRPAFVNMSPIASLIAPANGAIFNYSQNIQVSASASDTDGSIAQVQFFYSDPFGLEIGGATVTQAPYIALLTFNPLSSCCAPDQEGYYTYEVGVQATDNLGGLSSTSSVTIKVRANIPPTVNLASPATNSTFSAPASIPLTAQPADVDGTISTVAFYQGNTLITTLTAAPYSFNWTGVPQGTYTLTARATDNLGATITSGSVNVTVTAASAQQSLHFIHVDHLNTPRLVANSSGTTVWRWDQQEPFGVNVPDENPSGLGAFDLPLRLPGQYFDKETNLHYNYYRDYDPNIGRYEESDPIGLRGGLNTYAYVSSSPLSFVDPTGLLKWFGKFKAGALGIGKLGGFKAHFELESECDIDGMKGFATVDGYGATVGIGLPGSGVSGSATFVDGNIRVDPDVFRGRMRITSVGIQVGPVGLGTTTIFLGGAVSTDVDVDWGLDAGISFGIGGFADVIQSRKVCCRP
jgi:RHS repeat-associated protein